MGESFRARLICRVVRAWRERGRWAWIPGGGLRYAPFCTPNLRLLLSPLYLRRSLGLDARNNFDIIPSLVQGKR